MEVAVPVEERQLRDGLLTFADMMEARAAAETAPAPGPELHLLTFGLDREEFGIPVTQVREVIRVSEITRVPQAPPHVRGVANLRGRILAVVELRSRLGLPPAGTTPRSRWVVVEVRGRCSASWWWRSRRWKVPQAAWCRRRRSRLRRRRYLTGVAHGSRLIILLDLDKALLPTVAHRRWTDASFAGHQDWTIDGRFSPASPRYWRRRSSAGARWTPSAG
jgi:chemotaxis signal transduction protein